MVTFMELRDGQPARLGAPADEWLRMAEKLSRLETRVISELTKPLHNSGWAGDGADIAFRTLDKLDDEFELAARQVRNIATVIRFARTEFLKAQDQLQAVLTAAGRDGLRADDRGRVQPPGYVSGTLDEAAYQRYQQLIANAHTYTDQISAIVSRATYLDSDVGRVLLRFEPKSPGEMASGEWRDASADASTALNLLGLSERNIPAADTAPAAARAWWDGLSEEQRSLFLAAHPDRVGALDGLPAEQRHDANLMALRNLIETSQYPTGRLTTLLDRLEASEYGPPAQRLYLLGINNQEDGLGIVSVGNPDTAKNLAVAVVPGMLVTLDDMNGQIDRAAALRQTADDLTPSVEGDVAVVTWIGYNTPDGVMEARLHGSADAAAPVLDRFVDGTQVAQEAAGVQSHRVILGHSYGSTVVGLAASQGNGLAVDDIIVVGSPGMRVPDASHLNIDPSHVWAGRTADDPIQAVGPNLHGPSPYADAFGANRFHVDTSGHTDYWRPGSESLRNQANILVCQYDRVTLDHGTPPR